jgi:hypothetical protein
MSWRGLTVFRWGWTTFIVVLTSAPYLIDWWSTPAGYQFTWILPPYPEDSFGYMAWAQQAAHGAWLFKIKYTALPHAAFLFNPFFLICGWISALLRLDIGVVFLVVKAIGAVLLLGMFYRYTDYLRLNPTQSVTAAILLGVSSGFGGILAICGWINPSSMFHPADLWIPEVSTFWSLLWNPLFPLSLTLMLLSIYWVDRGTAEERASDLWLGGLAAGVMVLVHPYSLPLLFTMAAIIAVVRRKASALGYLFRYFAAAAPFAIYIIAASRANALVAKQSIMGEMKSPALAGYLLGFGFPLLLFVLGIVVARGEIVKRYWQVVIWFLLSILFAYSPFWFQRKFVFGAHIPLSILAGVALDLVLSKWPIGGARRVATAVAAVILLPFLVATPTYLLISQYQRVKANADGSYFVNNEIIDGLKILQQLSGPEDVVFATRATSRLIPAFSGNTVLWGHWAMSIDAKERRAWYANVFNAQSDEKRSAEFWGNDIQFVFADGEVRQRFENHPFMARLILRDANKVFENSSVVIYQRPGAASR